MTLIVAVAALAGLYWLAYRPHTYRYELTVAVDTPQGLRTGSTVREVKWSAQPKLMTGKAFNFTERGEAVAVDLPEGQTLFVVRGGNAYEAILAGLGPAPAEQLKPLLDQANRDRSVYTFSGRSILWKEYRLPMKMVRFRNINKPDTVEEVDPENLSASFGPGVRLRRVTIQITDKPVTDETEARLPWLPDLLSRGARLNGKTGAIFTNDLSENLGGGDFKSRE